MASQRIYQPGEDIGPYRVVRLIATGGMSTVYEASPKPDLRADLLRMGLERVAVKVANLDGLSGDRRNRKQLVDRLDREVETLVHLMTRTRGHPHVVKVFDAGRDEGIPYYAMEYVRGITLDEAMEKDRPRLGQMMSIFGKLCAAVSFLHNLDICHRDIKPSNVMLRCEDGAPVLIDFGICFPPGQRTLTRAGELVGTPQYLSPEYAIHWLSNPREAYLAAPTDDVWALGVVLYEILTGRIPWQTPPDRREALLREIRDVVPPHPCEVHDQVPRALGDAVMRLLEKDCEKRPANGAEVLGQVGAAAEGVDVLGRIPVRQPAPKPKKTGWTGALVRLATPKPAGSGGAPPPPPERERWALRFKGRMALAAFVVALVLFFVFWPVGNGPAPTRRDGPGQRALAARLEQEQRGEKSPEPGEAEHPDGAGQTADAGVIASNPMPDEPLKGQKPPPCSPKNEIEKKGGCWIEAVGSPPCHEGWYEDAGKCYMPVMLKRAFPSSVKK